MLPTRQRPWVGGNKKGEHCCHWWSVSFPGRKEATVTPQRFQTCCDFIQVQIFERVMCIPKARSCGSHLWQTPGRTHAHQEGAAPQETASDRISLGFRLGIIKGAWPPRLGWSLGDHYCFQLSFPIHEVSVHVTNCRLNVYMSVLHVSKCYKSTFTQIRILVASTLKTHRGVILQAGELFLRRSSF